jgi:hypothetical protein
MGFFKDIKSTVQSANEMAGHAASMQASVASATAGAPVDLNDPMWVPIHGVTVDRYAQLTAQMARQNLSGIEAVSAWLESQGVVRGTWADINTGWANRMATYEPVRTRYGIMYAQA